MRYFEWLPVWYSFLCFLVFSTVCSKLTPTASSVAGGSAALGGSVPKISSRSDIFLTPLKDFSFRVDNYTTNSISINPSND